jgi:hypothetical protein
MDARPAEPRAASPLDLGALRSLLSRVDHSEAHSFSRVFDIFQALTASPDFRLAGAPVELPHLQRLLDELAARVTGLPTASAQGLRAVRLQATHFVHGSCTISGRSASFLYFEEDERGLVALDDGDGMLKLSRLGQRR